MLCPVQWWKSPDFSSLACILRSLAGKTVSVCLSGFVMQMWALRFNLRVKWIYYIQWTQRAKIYSYYWYLLKHFYGEPLKVICKDVMCISGGHKPCVFSCSSVWSLYFISSGFINVSRGKNLCPCCGSVCHVLCSKSRVCHKNHKIRIQSLFFLIDTDLYTDLYRDLLVTALFWWF